MPSRLGCAGPPVPGAGQEGWDSRRGTLGEATAGAASYFGATRALPLPGWLFRNLAVGLLLLALGAWAGRFYYWEVWEPLRGALTPPSGAPPPG